MFSLNALGKFAGPAVAPRVRAQSVSAVASRNYSIAKVISILTVTAGHWFTGTILWIPVTFGLFVFAFSSGYFTSASYGERIERREFWRNKFQRLGLRYWIILAFIAVVLLLTGRPVWHWHSLVHLFGLSGVLNWAAMRNESGLGAGLWFFTLLLMFYLVYPYLVRAMRSKWAASAVLAGGFVLAVALEEQVKVGHELWLTAYGFIAGVAWGAHRPRAAAGWMLGLTAGLCIALVVLNLNGVNALNTVLITAASMAIAVWLTVGELPQWSVLDKVAKLDRFLLEIFLVHTYLFSRPTGNSPLDFVLSLGLILVVSVMLAQVADLVLARLLDSRRRAR